MTPTQLNIIKVAKGELYLTNDAVFSPRSSDRCKNLISLIIRAPALNASISSLKKLLLQIESDFPPTPIISPLSRFMIKTFNPSEDPLAIQSMLLGLVARVVQTIFFERIMMRIDPHISYMAKGVFALAKDCPESVSFELDKELASWQLKPSFFNEIKIVGLLIQIFNQIRPKIVKNKPIPRLTFKKIHILSTSKNEELQKISKILQFLSIHFTAVQNINSLRKIYSTSLSSFNYCLSSYTSVTSICSPCGIELLKVASDPRPSASSPYFVYPHTRDCAEQRDEIFSRYTAQTREQNLVYQTCYKALQTLVDPSEKTLYIHTIPFDLHEFKDGKLPSPAVFETLDHTNTINTSWKEFLTNEAALFFHNEVRPSKNLKRWLSELEYSLETDTTCITGPQILKPFLEELSKTDSFNFEYHSRVLEWFSSPTKALEREEYSHISCDETKKRIIFEHQIPTEFDRLVGTKFSKSVLESENARSYILAGFLNKKRFIFEYGFRLIEDKWICIHRWLNSDERRIYEPFCNLLFSSKAYDLHFPELGSEPLSLTPLPRESPTDYPIEHLEEFGVLRVQVGSDYFEFLEIS